AFADETIVTAGPIEALTVGPDLACQVTYQNDATFEFYPPDTSPGDCGTFVTVDDVLYAPDFQAHGTTATGRSDAPALLVPSGKSRTGPGTDASPSVTTTDATAAGGTIAIQQRTSYVAGQSSYRVDLAVRNLTGAPHAVRVYPAGDCYASGSDI